MEENLKKQKIKEISIAIAVCTVVLVCLAGLAVGLYNVFYNENEESVQTLSENKIEEDNPENVEIELIDPEVLEEEELGEETDEKEEGKELTEEEKQKREEELKKKQEEQRKKASEGYPYWIKVNYTANTITIYKKDDNGDYTIPVKAMVCSTGASTPRSGVYRTPAKAQWGNLIGSYGQYCTRITGQILFHSVPYLTKYDKSSLEYWEYDRLGQTRSLGCIRLTVEDALWLYNNCPLGTSVEFYSSSNPGPLGKPSAKKISGYGAPLMNWDPTDPDPNNPWRNQEKLEAEKKAAEEAARKAEEDRLVKEKAEQEEAARRKAEETAAEEAARKAEEERIAREQEEANKVQVPNVHGISEATARQNLQDFLVTVETVSDSTKVDGVVIWQSITAGTKVQKGTAITIRVNKIETIDDTTDDENNEADDSNT